jgi:hypothetical protein
MLCKKGGSVCPCAEIEHMAEGKPPHKPIEEIKAQDIDAENDEIRGAVSPDDCGQQKKGDCDGSQLKERSHACLLPTLSVVSFFHVFLTFSPAFPGNPAPLREQGRISVSSYTRLLRNS